MPWDSETSRPDNWWRRHRPQWVSLLVPVFSRDGNSCSHWGLQSAWQSMKFSVLSVGKYLFFFFSFFTFWGKNVTQKNCNEHGRSYFKTSSSYLKRSTPGEPNICSVYDKWSWSEDSSYYSNINTALTRLISNGWKKKMSSLINSKNWTEKLNENIMNETTLNPQTRVSIVQYCRLVETGKKLLRW